MTTSVELVTRANELMNRLQFAKAQECFRQALALDARSVGALVGLGRLALLKQPGEDGLALLDRALALHPNHAEALAVKGIYWMQKNEMARAIEVLEQAKVADPGLQMIFFNLGRSYQRIGNFPRAEENFRKAIEMNPDHFEAHSELGSVQAQTGRLEEGVYSILRAIRINRHFVRGYLAAGLLHEQAGEGDAAIRLYRSGLRHTPTAYPLRERLCVLYALKTDFRSAFAEALRIVKRRGLYSDYLRLGIYAVALREFETAEKAFLKSIQLNPQSWEGHYNLAELYMSAKLMDQASEQYQAAIGNSHDRYEPLNGMGLFLLMVNEDCDGAIALLKQALDLAPNRPEPRLNLALAYAKKRDFAAAEQFATSVLDFSKPDDPIYQQAKRLKGTILIENRAFRSLN